MLITVSDPDNDTEIVAAMQSVGFELRVREPGHRMFRTPLRDVHVHFWRDADPELRRHLRFRDRPRRSTEDRLRHETLKRELAARDWSHVQEYADARGALIETISARADD